MTHSNATLVPSGEISGLNGPWNRLTGPACGAPSLTTVGKSASTLPVRESLCSRSPGASAIISPVSAWETYE